VLYNIFSRNVETDLLPTCRRHGTAVITWSPLSGGWLTGEIPRRPHRLDLGPRYRSISTSPARPAGIVERLCRWQRRQACPLTIWRWRGAGHPA
jgi:aryl-alcohol dehydrogenase-like predicted oxidoreductase